MNFRLALPSAHERCQDCGEWVRKGNLCAVAKDFCDMRNGYKKICKEGCKPIWQRQREQSELLARIALIRGLV